MHVTQKCTQCLEQLVRTSRYSNTRQAAQLPPSSNIASGSRFFHLGPERDHGILDGLEYQKVQELAECDFVLNTGLYDDETEISKDPVAPYLRNAGPKFMALSGARFVNYITISINR